MVTKPNPPAIGPVVLTSGIQQWLADEPHVETQLKVRLKQFLDGDWGEVNNSEEDSEQNRKTITRKAGRLMGSYSLIDGRIFWIITDGYGQQKLGADFCHTTLLLPDEY